MTKNAIPMSRRTLLASLPASPLAISLVEPVAARSTDPLVAMHEEWMSLRREWDKLAKLPGNESLVTPPMVELEDRWIALEERMADCTPTSLEGIAALASLSWYYLAMEGGEEDAENRAVRSIWQACTGKAGNPLI